MTGLTPNGVTIVIPNWNHEIFLARSIQSALRGVEALSEAGVDAEVLVIDDASRDGSLVLLRQLEALHHGRGLRILARRQNGGLAAARNLGIAEARYRHMVFMDADNELVPENLPVVHRAIVETRAAMAYGNLLVRELGQSTAHHALSNTSFQTKIFDYGGNYIDAFAMIDRIQVIDAGWLSDACSAHEDYELWLHLATSGRTLVFVPVTLGYYYVLPNSMIKEDQSINIRANGKARRMFNQINARSLLPLRTCCRRYHPDLGEI